MQELSEDAVLKARFDAITEAQQRSRLALLLSSLACATILAAEWNAYLSWDRQWEERSRAPNHWAQQVVLEEQIKDWLETNTINVSLIGLRVSISDAAFLGSVILLVFSYYVCMSLRRENEEIGMLLLDMIKSGRAERERLLVRLRSTTVLSDTTLNDAPILTLYEKRPQVRILLARPVLEVLTFLPTMTVIVIVLSDLYFALIDVSPQRQNHGAAWLDLSSRYRFQLVLMDAFALAAAIFILNFCRYSSAYRRGTENVIKEFADETKG